MSADKPTTPPAGEPTAEAMEVARDYIMSCPASPRPCPLCDEANAKLARLIDAHTATLRAALSEAQSKLAEAERVWGELVALTGCTSPDGSAELEQVRFYKDRLAATEAERDEAIADATQARDDHHKLGAWPECPRCTQFFAQDMEGAHAAAELQARVARCHRLLQAADAAVSPEGDTADLSQRIQGELTGCPPGCTSEVHPGKPR